MLDNLGIVQLEAWDSPGENLERAISLARRRLGGVTLLEWIARRVTDAELLDRTVVLLPGDENGPAASLAALVPPDVPVCFATSAAPLARVAQAVVQHPCRGVVLVGVTSRLVDPDHIDQLIVASRSHPESDFIGFRAADQSASDFPQWCRPEALARLAALTTRQPGDAAGTSESHIAGFQQRWITLSAREQKLSAEAGAAADALDDGWEYAQTIFEHLGHECFDGHWVADAPQTQTVPRPKLHTGRALRDEVLEAN